MHMQVSVLATSGAGGIVLSLFLFNLVVLERRSIDSLWLLQFVILKNPSLITMKQCLRSRFPSGGLFAGLAPALQPPLIRSRHQHPELVEPCSARGVEVVFDDVWPCFTCNERETMHRSKSQCVRKTHEAVYEGSILHEKIINNASLYIQILSALSQTSDIGD